ncbi:preprotein translocase subunit YajC [Stieleria mannarensis]|uniref:preprotein translocase subunit YajC n=1 Tax=Stieleria mannarensis TaxID=2755585 RepID=UPI0016019868|nr:preprotein translocase subunit YajC [Rhodopirellula sp. JC639]
MPHLYFANQIRTHSVRIVIQPLLQFVPWLFLAEDVPAEVAEPKPFLLQLMENPLFPIAGIILIFYLTLIAPERRRKAEEAKRIAAIKKNDRVITNGGLHGTVVSAPSDSDVVTIRLDESGTLRVKVSRWALTVIEEKKPKDDAKD